ncbi:succinate dehydrogenase flavoprotein subunit [Escherichia coli]|uniref:Succinate dehydrogenase flavoprotein subunit n=1 Tax=Escherichia coli TaxID=562 RepID=A0A376RLS1_ECOLX|nr:succinate dehydrogenase flavoprotein subunit [Escherichia coli]
MLQLVIVVALVVYVIYGFVVGVGCVMKLPVREFDAVVIGAGGAGMRAALQISQSGQPVRCYLKSSRPVPIPFLRKAALPLRWVIPMKITGNGICTTP